MDTFTESQRWSAAEASPMSQNSGLQHHQTSTGEHDDALTPGIEGGIGHYKDQSDFYTSLSSQFSMLVTNSSFTSGLIAAFLALANDLAKDKDRQMFENGMLIALCAMGAHLGICTVAGRAAALCHVRATVKKSRVSAADFRKAFIICEHLQYLGTILFITSILYLSFVMFSTRVHPFIFVGISILEIVTISKSCYWKFSALNENMKKFLWKAKNRSQSAEDQEKMLG